jgi:hypothetical protein
LVFAKMAARFQPAETTKPKVAAAGPTAAIQNRRSTSHGHVCARLAYRHAEGEGEEFSLVNASCTLCLPLNSSERLCLLQSRAPSISQVDKGVQYLQQFLRVLKTQREIPISLPLNHASHPRW